MASVSAIISYAVGLIEWFYLSIAENAITDTCFSIIYGQAEFASQYNPVYGAIINLIPAIFTAGGIYAGLQAISSKLGL